MTRRNGVIVALGITASSCGPNEPEAPSPTNPLPSRGLQLLASCGGSVGKAYYLEPESAKGWDDDPITNKRTAFGIDAGGKLHIVANGASEVPFDAEQDGADIVVSKLDVGHGELVAAAVYKDAGVIESFNLTHDAKGNQVLLWTAVKNGSGFGIVKGGSYLSRCVY